MRTFSQLVFPLVRELADDNIDVADVAIQAIFAMCFTPEMYIRRPEFVDTLTDFVRGRPAQPGTRSSARPMRP